MRVIYLRVPSLIIILNLFIVFSQACNPGDKLRIIEKPIKSANDIVPITDSLVIPYVYTSAVSLKDLPVAQKKQKFFDMMLPAVLVAKKEMAIQLSQVEKIAIKGNRTEDEQKYLDSLMHKYNAGNVELLKSRLTTFPVSIVLAQSAVESAWGTSRFFIEANNPFGLWSFNPKEERIPAESTRSGKKVYLRKFNNLEEAIIAYYNTLNNGPFADFRKKRLVSQDPYVLVNYLIDYSERREAYIQELKSVIKGNNLTKYDSYRIDPAYIQ